MPSRTSQHAFTAALPSAARPFAGNLFSAASVYGIDPCLLAAICERESNYGQALDGAMTGDGGHGRGLMQIDDRAHRAWVESHDWRDPATNIEKGASILNEALSYFAKHPEVLDLLREPAGVAAYNAGAAAVLRAVRAGKHPDAVTTRRDYSADVFRRQNRLAAKAARAPE